MHKHIAEQFEFKMPPTNRCPHCNEPLSKSYCWFCQRLVTSKGIVAIFDELRFNRKTHLGNGDLILSREKQNEILDLLGKL